MSEKTVVGLQPWLPWPLSANPWWTEPVRAERLAALRIGLAVVLLIDVLLFYLPQLDHFFGPASLGQPHTFAAIRDPIWQWSLLAGVHDTRLLYAAAVAWALAAALLLAGLAARWAAALAWAFSISFQNLNPAVHNAGDTIRTILLFYLVLCPCAAAWSVGKKHTQPVYVPPWPIRLLFVQMIVIYFYNGLYKLFGPTWRAGHALHWVLADPSMSRFSYAHLPLPYWAIQAASWLVLAWELTFPLWMLWRWPRIVALAVGVAFHLGIALLIEMNLFSFYMLCMYLPLVPWERLFEKPSEPAASATRDSESGPAQESKLQD